MPKLVRFGVSMEEGLLARFDALIRELGYSNRSEAIRDLVRERLVRHEWEAGEEVVGVIVLLYEHHKRELPDALIDLQHRHHRLVIATMHVHLDADNCLEILAVRGPGPELQRLAEHLRSLKGVKHGQLAVTSTGRTLP
ncbi:nickel-responsive transcriptional regulator NikR [Candidatus Bipolaricaulota bacterium]|nr:nickel-responsive transcriptional regulator NikR [Candidatus Bipolaricaulota bacterium]